MDAQNLQLLVLTLFGIAGFFLFVGLLAFLQLDKLLLQNQCKVLTAKAQLQEAAAGRPDMAETPAQDEIAGKRSKPEMRIERIPLQLLQTATAHFSKRSLLHAGGSADIFIGSLAGHHHHYHQLTNVAMKRFAPPPITSPQFDPFFNELLIHTSISIHFACPTSPPHAHEQAKLQHTDSSLSAHSICLTASADCQAGAQQIPQTQLPSSWTISDHDSTSSTSSRSSSYQPGQLPQQLDAATNCSSFHASHSTPSLNPSDRLSHQHLSKCSYVLPLLGYCLEEQERLLIYEYAPNRDLARALTLSRLNQKARQDSTVTMPNDDTTFSAPGPVIDMQWITRLKIARQVAEALAFLHHSCQPPIIHGDLKASSILLTSNFDARLGSFSEAHTLDEGGSPLYDIYCYGKLLLHLILGTDVDDGMHMEDLFENHLSVHTSAPHDWSNHASFFQLVDFSMMVDEDFAKEILGVALLAKACVQLESSKSISMLTIVRFLKDPTKIVNE